MLGRAATRIDIKLEDDMQEYEEFKDMLRQRKEEEKVMQKVN